MTTTAIIRSEEEHNKNSEDVVKDVEVVELQEVSVVIHVNNSAGKKTKEEEEEEEGDGKEEAWVIRSKQEKEWGLLNGLKEAFKKNLIPGAVVFFMGLVLLVCYSFIASVEDAFDQYADFKEEFGFLFSSLSTAFFVGIVPHLVDVYRRHKTHRTPTIKTVAELSTSTASTTSTITTTTITTTTTTTSKEAYTAYKHSNKAFLLEAIFLGTFWAIRGAQFHYFYQLQSYLFGDDVTVATLLCKVSFDQFVYVPFVGVWTVSPTYLWKNTGFDWGKTKKQLNWHFIKYRVPVTVAGIWVIMVPVTLVLYSFPPSLQLPFFNFVAVFFSLVLTALSANE